MWYTRVIHQGLYTLLYAVYYVYLTDLLKIGLSQFSPEITLVRLIGIGTILALSLRASSDSDDTTGTSGLFIKSVSRRTTTSRTRLSRIPIYIRMYIFNVENIVILHRG